MKEEMTVKGESNYMFSGRETSGRKSRHANNLLIQVKSNMTVITGKKNLMI